MSNRMFQGIIHQMKDAIERPIGVVDETGTIVSSSDPQQVDEVWENLPMERVFTGETVRFDGKTIKAFDAVGRPEYAVFVEGTDEDAARYAGILCISIGNIKHYYDEKYDKKNFVKNVVLDNILAGDIFVKARELHLSADALRIAMLIRTTSPTEISVYEVIQGLFPDKQKDFIFNITETDTVLIKEVTPEIEVKDVERLAESIIEILTEDYYMEVVIGVGTITDGIRDLAKSFKEAQVALEVGKVFDQEKNIITYENLGIARLIYQLPTTLCEMFLKEVFRKGSIESLDQETLFTIQRFFENNLNVSETSRGLFVHRNTLVYRLEKIKKLTGLDLREFEQAIVFKVALMVKKYLSANPVKF